MYEWYYADSEDADAALDELLCEYVDGTMDDCVRVVFEECLCADYELAEQVEELRRTRMMLCRFAGRHQVPEDLRRRLRSRLAAVLAGERELCDAVDTSSLAARIGLSSVSAVFVIALFVGSAFMDGATSTPVADAAGMATPVEATFDRALQLTSPDPDVFPVHRSALLPTLTAPLDDTLSFAILQSHP